MNLNRAYRPLLRLYPSDYRALFAAEMQHAFQQAAEEHRLLGRSVWMRFILGEFLGLLMGAAEEWIAKRTTDRAVRGRCLPDVRMMRPPGVPRDLWFRAGSRS